MEFIESTHAKSTWTLVGGPTFLISSLILILKMIIWFLIEFDSSWRYAWICFIFIVEPTLLPNKVLKLLSRYALHHPIFKIPWISMSSCTMSMLDACLTCLDKMHVECYTSILTLMFCDSAREAVQVRILTFLYCDLILFGMLFYLESPSLLRYL